MVVALLRCSCAFLKLSKFASFQVTFSDDGRPAAILSKGATIFAQSGITRDSILYAPMNDLS